jgi:hypothetical protein
MGQSFNKIYFPKEEPFVVNVLRVGEVLCMNEVFRSLIFSDIKS